MDFQLVAVVVISFLIKSNSLANATSQITVSVYTVGSVLTRNVGSTPPAPQKVGGAVADPAPLFERP